MSEFHNIYTSDKENKEAPFGKSVKNKCAYCLNFHGKTTERICDGAWYL